MWLLFRFSRLGLGRHAQIRSGRGGLEAGRDGPDIGDDLAVARPDKADRLWRADAGRARIAGRPEPVVLRRSCCARADARIRRSIHRVCQHLQECKSSEDQEMQTKE